MTFFCYFLCFCACYSKVRDLAREAVLKMDLSAKEAYDLCKRSFQEGWVSVGDETSSGEGDCFGSGSVRFGSVRFGSVRFGSARFGSAQHREK